MASLDTDLIELVPLDSDNEVHVETYRQSRNEPEMRATGAYGECNTVTGARKDQRGTQYREPERVLCDPCRGHGRWLGRDEPS